MKTTITTTDRVEANALAAAAVVANDIGYIKRDIGEIKDSLKALPGMYLTQKEHLEFAELIENRLCNLENRNTVQRYLFPILSSVATAVLVLLTISFLQSVK